MAYFKIGTTDFSSYVNELKITKTSQYNAQTNAAGDTVVDYLNQKRKIEVGIIPLTSTQMATLQTAIDGFNVSISYRDPKTNTLVSNVNCIIPSNDVEYYTIQTNKVLYKGCNLTFSEL
ncbi:MAG: hypothetical protein KBT27_02185 [Prevotellaceae bacterium]|nr:hypothetical protein [Candidatus Faecinaster equi]